MGTKTWTLKHEDEFLTEVEPKDARELRLAMECGYRWINKNDGEARAENLAAAPEAA